MYDPRPVLAYVNPIDNPPPGSRVIREVHEDGVTYTILPERSVPQMMSLVLVGAVTIGAFLLSIAQAAYGLSHRARIDHLMVAPITLLFAGFLGVVWLALYRPMRYPSTLSYRDGRLVLHHAASLTGRPRVWSAAEILGFTVALRGFSLRMRTSGDLRLAKEPWGHCTLLAGRDRAELQWIAQGLNAVHARPEQ